MARNSRAYRERRFDPRRPVYVRKPMKANGVDWDRGARFDWYRMAISQRRVRQLVDAGKLKHDESELEQSRVDEPPKQDNTKRVDTEVGPVDVQTPDELDEIDDMRDLRRIANNEGAKTTTSKTLQRKYIREKREEAKSNTGVFDVNE